MTDERNRDMAIAVIGLAGRFPGARDTAALWRNLTAGVESITVADAPPGHVTAGGVLDDIDRFDAAFFRSTRPEAEQMDPQHRLFLESSWSALESAGHAPGRAMRAGVYAGCAISTYMLSNVMPHAEEQGIGGLEILLGSIPDFLATRVAYKLNLTGPAISVAVGCSTSLVAVHLACQALLAGECDLALAGGATIRVPQLTPQRYQEGSVLARDGHCRAFDAGAAGTVTGNGVGVVVLRRLADALADRDPIRAVVLGTAVNNDGGEKSGFAAPSVAGQSAVIREALDMAGVEPRAIGYVEAHGTGTLLGDPIEVAALRRVFAGAPAGACGLGSVKTNIGHLDSAAGIAGFIKAVLAVEHAVLPPSLHFVTPNPRLELEGSPFFVVAAPGPWRVQPRRAGVSSYGVGGTNAHAVLEQAPVVPGDPPRRASELVVVSACTPAALDRMVAELAQHLEGCPANAPDALADLAHTLQVGRAQFGCRRFVVASDPRAAAASLGGARTELAGVDRRAVLAFPGSGVQRVNMGRELAGEPAFDGAIARCAELLRSEIGGDLRDVMFAGADRFDAVAIELDRPFLSQLAIFACDWAIAQQWLAWGVAPQALLGHSLGEYVAACLAGVFSLEDALALVVARARLFEAMPAGAMVSILAAPDEIAPLLGDDLAVAAVNGPASCVVSGPPAAVTALEAALTARGTQLRRLRVSRAMHSAMLDPQLPGFARVASRIALHPPEIPVASCVTGTWLDATHATDPDYWVRHLRQTVRFSDAVTCVLGGGPTAVIEAGPAATLTSLVRQHPAAAGHRMIATLPPAPERSAAALVALGEVWLAGVEIDWERFRAGERRRRVVLPTYSFERERYWLDAVAPPAARVPHARSAPHMPSAPHAPPASPDPTTPAPRAPRSAVEAALAACYHDVFRVADLGIDDDFFELGGDSLLGLRLAAQIERRLGLRVALKDVLEATTVRALAARIGERAGVAERAGTAERDPTTEPTEQRLEPGRRPMTESTESTESTGVPGSSDLTARIAAHWRELLGVESPRPGDDFLALGGNSMLATMLANRIEDELGVRPEIVDLFTTLERTVALCESLGGAARRFDNPQARRHGARYRANGWWRDTTFLADLAAAARATPDRPAIIATRTFARDVQTIRYRELAEHVDRFASALLALGVGREQIVAVQLPSWWQFTALALACARIGAVIAPLPVDYRRREVELVLDRTAATVYIGPASWLGFSHQQLLRELAGGLPALRHRVLFGAGHGAPGAALEAGELEFDAHVSAAAARPRNELDRLSAQADDVFLVMYTSGTTGEPKGIVHSHNTLYAITRALIETAGLSSADVITTPSPMAGLVGFLYDFLVPLLAGATAVYADLGDPDLGLRLIEEHGATFTYAIPNYLLGLVAAQQRRPRRIERLRTVVTGSAPVPPHLIASARDALGVRVQSLWGMTEMGGATFTWPDDPPDWPAHSDGRPIAWMECRIVPELGDDGKPLPGGAGRLRVRGANQCLGYFARDDVYAALVDDDGWFDTGDLARSDGRGGIRIVGRVKDIIVRNGQKVPVAEVESALYSHPKVSAVALVPDPDPELGERVCAVVLPRDAPPTLTELRDHLRGLGMAAQYWPDRLELIDAMPTTSTGKIQKFVLQEQLQARRRTR